MEKLQKRKKKEPDFDNSNIDEFYFKFETITIYN